MAATDSFFHWLKARDLVWKLCYFWSLFFILSRLKTYFFSTFLVITYHGLQIIKGNSQSVQNTNFAKYKILQLEVSLVCFNYFRKPDEDSWSDRFLEVNDREFLTGNFHPIFLKKFVPPSMLGFPRGMKSIRSALLNLVELGPRAR